MMNSIMTFGDLNSGVQIGHNQGPINIHLPLDTLSTDTAGEIISLGLQVCQEISSGYQTWRGYDQEFQSIGNKAGSLLMPLKKLRDMIKDTRITHPEIAKDLEEKAMSLKGCVERLEAKKAAYLFRKDALREMSNDLDGIQQGLQTALAIYSTREIIGLVTSQETIMNELRQLVLLPTLCIWISANRGLKRLTVTAGNKPPPSFIRSCCDHGYQQAPFAKASSEIEPQSTKATGSAIFRYPRPKKSIAVTRSYVYYSRLLQFTITASFSMSTGAGGFSIAPTLHMQFIRADDDWSYGVRDKWDSEVFEAAPCREFNQTYDDIICLFQQAFSEGTATPSDTIPSMSSEDPVSFVDLFEYVAQLEERRDLVPGLHKLVRFLLHCGSKPNNSRGILRSLCARIPFQEEEYALATQLISVGGPLIFEASEFEYYISFTEKRNIKYLLSRDEDSVSMPDIPMVILQELKKELEELLESRRILPDTKVGNCSILEIAFGWSDGVKILLDSGASEQNSRFPLWRVIGDIEEADPDHYGYYHSAEQLLELGWTLSVEDIATCRSVTLRSLLIKELASRRKRLWELAQSYLPPDKLPSLRQDELLDIDAGYVYAVLVDTGRKLDPSLRPLNPGATVYHCRGSLLSAEAMEELYQAGFHGVDLPGVSGTASRGFAQMTPIIAMYPYTSRSALNSKRFVKNLKWFISKGADVSRNLPGTNARVAHLLSERISWINMIAGPSEEDKESWGSWLPNFSPNKRKDPLLPLLRDACDCACCPGGCTTLSVALRLVFRVLPDITSVHYRLERLRRLLEILIQWHGSYPKSSQVLIRFFTFDALSLTHTCCTGLSTSFPYKPESRDKSEIDDILEEQKERLKDLESLVSKLEAKFEELGLPVLEFLEGYWHSCMIQFLSKVDPYDEEHHKEARKLGVVLEVDERPVPRRLSLFIGARIKDVIDEELDGLEC